MNFDHQQMNKIFGVAEDHRIPFIRIDNPLFYILNLQKEAR